MIQEKFQGSNLLQKYIVCQMIAGKKHLKTTQCLIRLRGKFKYLLWTQMEIML